MKMSLCERIKKKANTRLHLYTECQDICPVLEVSTEKCKKCEMELWVRLSDVLAVVGEAEQGYAASRTAYKTLEKKYLEAEQQISDGFNKFVNEQCKVKELEGRLEQIRSPKVLEKLAELEHEQWIEFMEAIESTPLWKRTNWDKLRKTPYCKLTEKEKESDRKFARRVLAVLEEAEK